MRTFVILLLAVISPPVPAEGTMAIGIVGQERPRARPVSTLDREPRDKGLNVPGRAQVRALSGRHAPDHITDVIRNQQRLVGADRYANRPAVRLTLISGEEAPQDVAGGT